VDKEKVLSIVFNLLLETIYRGPQCNESIKKVGGTDFGTQQDSIGVGTMKSHGFVLLAV
jgi:hypothetical protein